MKSLVCLILLTSASLLTMSFRTMEVPSIELVNTKWISPINDHCYESLCFTSDRTVMYYRCETDLYLEVGYTIDGHRIEIEAYGESSMNPKSKLILYEDNGVFRQDSGQFNSFPRNFIKVPNSICD